jgi:hypothetical protein
MVVAAATGVAAATAEAAEVAAVPGDPVQYKTKLLPHIEIDLLFAHSASNQFVLFPNPEGHRMV